MKLLALLRIVLRIVPLVLNGQHVRGSWQTTLAGLMVGIGTPLSVAGQGVYRDIGLVLVAIGAPMLGIAAPTVANVRKLEKSVNERLAERQRK